MIGNSLDPLTRETCALRAELLDRVRGATKVLHGGLRVFPDRPRTRDHPTHAAEVGDGAEIVVDPEVWKTSTMYAVATFLVVAVITLVFGQLATGALIATGMPPDVAAFQARSAFSGAGFTTTEAENVVNHPDRRRIIATTMFVGSLGTPTMVVTVLLGFLAPGPGSTSERTLVIASGVVGIVLMVGNRPFRRAMVRVGQHYANRRLVPALGGAVDELLAIDDGFIVGSIRIATEPGDTYRSLRALEHAIPGCTVLGVRGADGYRGEPPADLDLEPGGELVVYGHRDRLRSLHDEATR